LTHCSHVFYVAFSLKAVVDMGAGRSGISADDGAPFPAAFQDFAPSTGFQNLSEGLTAPSDLGALCELSGPSQSDLIKVRFGALLGL
jgi:hypothetical protein